MIQDATPNAYRGPNAARGLDVLAALVLGSLASGVAIIAAGLIIVAMQMWSGHAAPGASEIAGWFKTSPILNQLSLVVSDSAFLAVMWAVARRRVRHPITSYFPPVSMAPLLKAALSGVAVAAFCELANEALTRASLVSFHQTEFERNLVPHTAGEAVLVMTIVIVFVPFVEEFFYRGILLGWLCSKLRSLWVPIVVSALVFALSHGYMIIHPGTEGWIDTAEIVLAGIVMAYWAVRTGSLRASLAVHAAFNATSMLIATWLP
jgi:membrane protease YdiL (CAAX protease family)